MSHWDWVVATTQFDRTRVGRRRLGGVRLDAVRSDGLLEGLGLRRGDVVWTANGQAITDSDALQRAIGGLTEPGHMTLVVNHGGQRLAYDYDSH